MSISQGHSLSQHNNMQVMQQIQPMEAQNIQIYGMYFCGTCNNLLVPSKQMNQKLQFRCKLCDKKYIDFSKKQGDQCILYNKQIIPGSRNSRQTQQLIWDNTIPKVQFQCLRCNNPLAYYIVTVQQGESSISIILACQGIKSGRCWNTTKLPPQAKVQDFKIVMPEYLAADFQRQRQQIRRQRIAKEQLRRGDNDKDQFQFYSTNQKIGFRDNRFQLGDQDLVISQGQSDQDDLEQLKASNKKREQKKKSQKQLQQEREQKNLKQHLYKILDKE